MAAPNPTASIDAFLGLPDRNANPAAWNAAIGGAITQHSGQSREELMRQALALQAQLYSRPQDFMTVKGGNVGPNQPSRREQLIQQARELQSGIAQRASLMFGPQERSTAGAPRSPAGAALRSGTERFTNNLMFLPNLAMRAGTAVYDDAAKKLAMVSMLGQSEPNEIQRAILTSQAAPPRIGAEHVQAAAQRVGEFAGAVRTGDSSFFQPGAVDNQRRISEATQEQFPVASTIGDVSGDVATIAMMRAPIARARSLAHLTAAERANAIRVAAEAAQKSGHLPGWRYAYNTPEMIKRLTTKSAGFGNLMNLAGRTTEAGIEGAMLAMLHEGDPVQMGIYSAAVQGAGGLLLGGLGGLIGKGLGSTGLNIAAAGASAAAILQYLKSGSPGGKDFSLESLESGFNKVFLASVAGVLAGAFGLGRLPVGNYPAMSDYLTSIPRAAMLSTIEGMMNDPVTERVVMKLKTDPYYFGQDAARKIERAFKNPNVSLTGVIDSLMKTKSFSEKYAELEKQ